MFRKLIKTGDGSHSLYVEELNEHYHSIHGALQESKHVFIEAGLKQAATIFFSREEENRKISVLEIGLGTGLNVLLTLMESQQLTCKVDYTALEAFPLSKEIIANLNYTELLSISNHSRGELQFVFHSIHSCMWNQETEIVQQFTLNKLHTTLQQVELPGVYDLVYFDAFGPEVQPEMWTYDMFLKIIKAMSDNGILVTYCAKGIVKRTLKEVGFKVETLQGPPGKREMVRAVKKI